MKTSLATLLVFLSANVLLAQSPEMTPTLLEVPLLEVNEPALTVESYSLEDTYTKEDAYIEDAYVQDNKAYTSTSSMASKNMNKAVAKGKMLKNKKENDQARAKRAEVTKAVKIRLENRKKQSSNVKVVKKERPRIVLQDNTILQEEIELAQKALQNQKVNTLENSDGTIRE